MERKKSRYETNPTPQGLPPYAYCGAANFGGSRPFEAALRQDDQRRLKSRLAATIGGPTWTTLSGKLL